MKPHVTILRVIATIYGAYLLVTSIYFLTTQAHIPLRLGRTVLDVVAILGYAFLLLPYRKVSSGALRITISIILSVQVIWVVYGDIHRSIVYLSSQGGWEFLAGLAIGLAILVGNLWAFFEITRKSAGQRNATPEPQIEQ